MSTCRVRILLPAESKKSYLQSRNMCTCRAAGTRLQSRKLSTCRVRICLQSQNLPAEPEESICRAGSVYTCRVRISLPAEPKRSICRAVMCTCRAAGTCLHSRKCIPAESKFVCLQSQKCLPAEPNAVFLHSQKLCVRSLKPSQLQGRMFTSSHTRI